MNEEHMTFSEGFRFVILLINFMILSGLLLFGFVITAVKVVGLLLTLPFSFPLLVLWVITGASILVVSIIYIVVIDTLWDVIFGSRGRARY